MDVDVSREDLCRLCRIIAVILYRDFFTNKVLPGFIEDLINAKRTVLCNKTCFFTAKEIGNVDMLRYP